MGIRREKQRHQEQLWIAHTELPGTAAHPFYEQLNRVLEGRGFDGVPPARMLDANAARAELEAKGMPEDPGLEKMLSATDEKLKVNTKARLEKSAHSAGVKRPFPALAS